MCAGLTVLVGQPKIRPHEIVQWLGLVVARVLCPHAGPLSLHWKTRSTGAVPAGTFGAYMSRNRFDFICRCLHFSDNLSPRSQDDRAWKLRPIIDMIQQVFQQSYVHGEKVSFDEMMLPNRHRANPMRQYCPMKPRKYGVKLFATCCAETAYCSRYVLLSMLVVTSN